MEKILLILALVVISISLVTAGRFRYPLQPGSRMDRFFVRLQIVGNIVALAIALLLPSATEHQGLSSLSYIAAVLEACALALIRVKLPAPWSLWIPPAGKRAAEPANLDRTRWPYQTLFALGYMALLAYVLSVFRFFF